jgi:hypothetical protein
VCLALQTLVDVLPSEPAFSAVANLATAVGVKAQLLASPAPGSSVSLVVALVSAVHRYGVETFLRVIIVRASDRSLCFFMCTVKCYVISALLRKLQSDNAYFA